MFLKAEGRLLHVAGSGEWGEGTNGHGVTWGDENILLLDHGDGGIAL